MTNKENKGLNWNVILIVSALLACIGAGMLVSSLVSEHQAEAEAKKTPEPTEAADLQIMDSFDRLIQDALAQAHDAAAAVPKIYWIDESAPAPNSACYGEADDPAAISWLLEEAAELLDGQSTAFHTDVELAPNSTITYYLDESIMVIAWQQVLDDYVYTFAEVKISHPSQFRRYLAQNEFNSDYLYPVYRMADMVNAVMASSADHYRGRNQGIVVYNGIVEQSNYADKIDTCFIDQNGDLILVPAGTLEGHEEIQQFVDENNIHSSIAFGPILVSDGKRCAPKSYYLGEINDKYPRAALCQMDSLHYVVVMANSRDTYRNSPTIRMFAKQIEKLGCEKAYTLDGGKTGTIFMNGNNLNPRTKSPRWVSDIIYFATAIPSSGDNEG